MSLQETATPTNGHTRPRPLSAGRTGFEPVPGEFLRSRVAAFGRCVEHPDPDVWFPAEDAPVSASAVALAECGRCLVRGECLEFVLRLPAEDDHGIWGGTTERKRRAMRKVRAAAAAVRATRRRTTSNATTSSTSDVNGRVA